MKPRHIPIPYGTRFERLVVVSDVTIKNRIAYYECQCDCGARVIAVGSQLRRGITKSCGCYKSDVLRCKRRKWLYDWNRSLMGLEIDDEF